MIRIFKTSLSSSSDSPEGLTAELGQQTSPGRRGFGLKSSGHRSPGGGASILANKRLTLPFLAFVAVLAAGLLFLLPGGLLQAQSAEQFFDYPENGDGAVATFTASDPEDAMPVVWSLTTAPVTAANVVEDDIDDNALFKIDQNGVLSFKDSPNYEAPVDDGTDNEYRVTVQASDGDQTGYFEVYVNVTDEEETGKVTWSVDPDGDNGVNVPDGVVLRRFQPGATLAASVTDPDAVVTDTNPTGSIAAADVTWKWYRGSSVIAGEAEASYDVTDSDVGNTIRVMATYSDGSGSAESVSLTSASVQAFRRSNDPPAFASATVTRRIAENSTGNVGGPVAATDANGDTLTYAITGGDDQASFRIDPATGQLMVGPSLMIDFEDAVNTDDSYTVQVTAYDSSGAATDPAATVTINVIDEEEKPEFGTVAAEANLMRATVVENVTGDDLDIATYTATDPEGESVSLSLMGDDAGLFELAADTEGGNDVSQVLSFKKSPDFEMPGDRNDDNLYEVTVRASDGTMSADRMVVVKVTNEVEDGKVTLSPEDAVPGVELTATLTDPEGSVSASGQITGERWTWHRASAETFTADTSNAIANATSPTYTPASDDDVGMYLRAMVSYVYQYEGDADEDRKTGVSDAVQVQTSHDNQAPRFKEGASTFRVVAESVAALASDDSTDDSTVPSTDDNIGSPVDATDANDDTVTYTLGGADASLFRIRSDDGQLEVKGKLDHEADRSHTVTVTANDGSGGSNATDSITVTIYVTDADDAPKIRDRAAPSANGQRTVTYPENGDGYVARFTASDPEGAMPVVWSLTDAVVTVGGTQVVSSDDIADEADFKIDQDGVLIFRTSPSYEPRGDNDYRVTVEASDGNQSSYFKVTVDVTDREETGKVTWDVTPTGVSTAIAGLRRFQPGAELAASVTDPDAVTDSELNGAIPDADVTWKWYRGSSVIAGEAEASYDVTDSDVGSTIRVIATYSDGSGPEESVSLTSASVQGASQSNDAPEFAPATVSRRIAENSTGNIGGPVAATDANGDTLTYAITGGDDQASFRIDPATGQLMVGPSLMIDFEDAVNTDDSYTVQVTAYDSSGAATDPAATVTINVIDEEEKPEFGTVAAEANLMRATVVENVTGDDLDIATYTATDPEGESVSLSLMGDDAGLFELAADTEGGNDVSQVLSFKKSPDFEMPGDRNDDNLYEVTVRASDGTMSADRMVVVKVTNEVEDGKVTLSPEDAVLGVELTATLTDPEGSVSASGQITGERWTWHRASAETFTADTSNAIANATSPTYTPASADDDVGMYLRAMVSYVYQYEGDADEDRKTGVSDAVQVQTSHDNQAPRFKEGASTFRVVAESVAALASDDSTDDSTVPSTDDNIGSPVDATDANDDTVTYTLGGADASLFRIRSDDGQLEVKGKLDHEADRSHTVTVTANDGSGGSNDSASITVTIYVTDADEEPKIMAGGLAISGSPTLDYPEMGTDVVETYTVTGPDAASATWSLEGDDANDFRISSGGMLTFRSSPNYEMPMDTNSDNTYMVTLKASDGTYMDTHDVMVMVTNMEEDGSVTLSPMNPVVDTAVTASLTDPDIVTEDSVMWQWSKSMEMDGEFMDIDGATMMTYTPVAADDGYYLKATAMYTDGHGSGKSAMETTTGMVTTVQDQDGVVMLSSMDPVAGVALTATLTDGNGGVTGATWQWSKSMTMDGTFMDITDATSRSYTPMAADEGYYLRATVMYTDAQGPNKSAMATTTNKVVADADALLVARYDTNGTPGIQKAEVIAAINDYLFGEGDDAISKADVIRLINMYLFPNG